MDETVLVGIDGSAQSRHALSVAIAEAGARGWSVRLVSVYPDPAVGLTKVASVPGYAARVRDAAKPILDEMAGEVRQQGLDVDAEIEAGNPVRVLVDKSHQAGVMVIGASGSGRIAGQLLGSVAGTLSGHARCPVIVVPDPAAVSTGTHRLPDEEHHLDYSGRVVVAVDSAETSKPALREAAAAAARRNQPLTVVNVMDVHVGLYNVRITPYYENYLRSETDETLEECLRWLQDEYPGLDANRAIHEGRPGPVLAAISETASLTVVGSRGRGGFAGLILGSTSQSLLHRARGPVMVVHNS